MKQHNASMLFRVFFLALLFLPGFCSSSWAEDCGVRGNDGENNGGTEVVKLDCEAAIPPTSPLRVAIPDGAGGQIIRGLNLVAPMISGAPNPAASKFRVNYIDNSTGTPTETIKAIGYILPGITACEELQMIGYHPAYLLNKTYKLGSDVIDCSATDSVAYPNGLWAKGYNLFYEGKGFDRNAGTADDVIPALEDLGTKGFKPIGSSAAPFTGTFKTLDGHTKTINGLMIKRSSESNVGLFGVASGATIRNVGLAAGSVNGGSNVGSLVGSNRMGTTQAGTITNCYATVNVSGSSIVGGLVGENNNASIAKSYAGSTVSGGSYIGGLVGSNNNNATIINSYAWGAVSGGNRTGGLVGYNDSATITNCYSQGNVRASSTATGVGGLVGNNSNAKIISSYTTSNLSGGWIYLPIGGLAGGNSNYQNISNSWWYNNKDNAIGGSGAGPGYQTSYYEKASAASDFNSETQFVYIKRSTSPFPNNAWDFESDASPGVWKSRANGLPYLKWQDG